MSIVIVVLVMSFGMKQSWWVFTDVFFGFMTCFFHLLAVYMRQVPRIARMLDLWAFVFGVLTIVAIIGIWSFSGY